MQMKYRLKYRKNTKKCNTVHWKKHIEIQSAGRNGGDKNLKGHWRNNG